MLQLIAGRRIINKLAVEEIMALISFAGDPIHSFSMFCCIIIVYAMRIIKRKQCETKQRAIHISYAKIIRRSTSCYE